MEISKTFCILPFIHQDIQVNGDVFLCCKARHDKPLGNTHQSNPKEIWNSKRIKEVRKELIDGKWPKECIECKESEDSGQLSLRKKSNFDYQSSIKSTLTHVNQDGQIKSYNLEYIALRFSNFCNLTCVYCDENYSSSWAKVKGNEVNVSSFSDENQLYNFIGLHRDTLKRIYISGGEPLLDPKHFSFLNYLVENNITDLELVYNTNATFLENSKYPLLKTWNEFKNIHLSLSIDDLGERFNYIRRKANWNNVKANIKDFNANGIGISFFITVSNLNLLNLANFIKSAKEEFKLKYNSFELSILTTPKELSINNLPNELIKKSILDLNIFRHELIENDNKESVALRKDISSLINKLKAVTPTNKNFSSLLQNRLTIENTTEFNGIFPEFRDYI